MAVQVFGTYSASDTFATLAGPGVSVSVASGSGEADEGVSLEQTESSTRLVTGADGGGFHTLILVQAARIRLRFLKMSPTNSILTAAMNYQRGSSFLWGKNELTLTNPATGDSVYASGIAFTKMPNNSWGKEGAMLEWELEAIYCQQKLGSGSVLLVS